MLNNDGPPGVSDGPGCSQPRLAPPAFWFIGVISVLAGFEFGWADVRRG